MSKKYCGNCGIVISKKKSKSICPECNIERDEFTEPYNKMKPGIVVTLAIFYIAILSFTFFFLTVPHDNQVYFLYALAWVGAIYYTIKARIVVKNGFIKCKKCKKTSSLKAKFCIYCGSRIGWAT